MKRMTAGLLSLVALSTLWLLSSGCAVPATDLVASGAMRVERPASALGQAAEPKVLLRSGVLDVSGTVRPSNLAATRPAGRPHVELIFVSLEGQVLHAIPWWPEPAKGKDEGPLDYSLLFGWRPPRGTTLYVAYVDDQHLPAGGYGGGGYAGGVGVGLVGYGGPGGLAPVQTNFGSMPRWAGANQPARPAGAAPGYGGPRR